MGIKGQVRDDPALSVSTHPPSQPEPGVQREPRQWGYRGALPRAQSQAAEQRDRAAPSLRAGPSRGPHVLSEALRREGREGKGAPYTALRGTAGP